nr:MAG TPA: hypothetical protein [Bacteriophage sp.]
MSFSSTFTILRYQLLPCKCSQQLQQSLDLQGFLIKKNICSVKIKKKLHNFLYGYFITNQVDYITKAIYHICTPLFPVYILL